VTEEVCIFDMSRSLSRLWCANKCNGSLVSFDLQRHLFGRDRIEAGARVAPTKVSAWPTV